MAIFNPSLDEIAKFKTQPTEGEQTLLDFLEKTLDDSYEIFFQPHINGDCPDIVIMRKDSGIMIIEVKDWHLDSYNILARDVWELKNVINQYSGKQQKVKSPVAQVENYKNNLYNLHIDELVDKKILDSNYYSMINCVVYLHNSSEQKINEFLTKNGDYSEGYCEFLGSNSLMPDKFNRMLAKRYMNRKSKLFTEELYKKISRVLQPVAHTLEQGREISYTSDQKKIIHSRARSRQKVRGVAGSGKTQALAQRAVHAYERTGEEVLVLTFNISLRNYIHDRISHVRKDSPWKYFTILHYHAFIKAYCNNHNLCIDENFDKNDEQQLPEFPVKYKTIIVDEIQDYKKAWVHNIHNLLAEDGEILFLGDEKQNIYRRDMDKQEKRPYTGLPGNWTTLKTSFRISNGIADLADEFQKAYLVERYDYDKIACQMDLSFEQSNITYYSINDLDEQAVVNIYNAMLLHNNIHDNEACFLSARVEPLRAIDQVIRLQLRKNTQAMFETQELYEKIIKKHKASNGMIDHEAVKMDVESVRRSRKFNFWMNSGKTKLSTIHSFKGWEIPTLILIIENDPQKTLYDDNIMEFTTDELIYTAITRCKQNLIIINAGNKRYHDFFIKNIGEQDTKMMESSPTNKSSASNVAQLLPGYKVVEFPWGAAVWDCKDKKWSSIYLPTGQEIDCKNMTVALHDNGIQFIKFDVPKK